MRARAFASSPLMIASATSEWTSVSDFSMPMRRLVRRMLMRRAVSIMPFNWR